MLSSLGEDRISGVQLSFVTFASLSRVNTRWTIPQYTLAYSFFQHMLSDYVNETLWFYIPIWFGNNLIANFLLLWFFTTFPFHFLQSSMSLGCGRDLCFCELVLVSTYLSLCICELVLVSTYLSWNGCRLL